MSGLGWITPQVQRQDRGGLETGKFRDRESRSRRCALWRRRRRERTADFWWIAAAIKINHPQADAAINETATSDRPYIRSATSRCRGASPQRRQSASEHPTRAG